MLVSKPAVGTTALLALSTHSWYREAVKQGIPMGDVGEDANLEI